MMSTHHGVAPFALCTVPHRAPATGVYTATSSRTVLDTWPPREHPLDPCTLLPPLHRRPAVLQVHRPSSVHRRCCVMPRAVSLCVVIAPSWSTPSCSQPPVTWHTPSTITLSPRHLLCASTQARPLLRTTRSVPQATQTPRPPRSCALVLTHSTSFFNWFSASTSLSLKRYSAPNIPRVWHLSNFSPTHPCIKSITMSLLTAEGLPHPPLPRRRAASCHHRSPSPTSSSTVAVVHPTITHATVTSPFPFLF